MLFEVCVKFSVVAIFTFNRPPPPPSQSLLTLEDFMQCVSVTKTEDDRRKKMKDQERERDLMDFKRMLNLPP